jgi:Bacterial archaeo-eukaryotic release factor family 2
VDLHDPSTVLSGEGPFATVLVDSESDVEQAADKYELQWKNVLRELEDKGVDARTREAVGAGRGAHSEGAARLVVASVPDATVRLAVSLPAAPRRAVVDVAPLPHLLPLVDDASTRVPHVVVLADRTGADVSAHYDTDTVAREVTVKGHAPDIRKVPVGGWSHLRYQHRAENGWAANAKEIVTAVVDLAKQVDAQLIVLVGDERELVHVREDLPQDSPEVVEVAGGRGQDGSAALVRRRVADVVALHVARGTLDLLAEYAQERGQGKRACDGLPDVLEALRRAQVETLLITTDTEPGATLWFGPEPTQVAATVRELTDLGVQSPQEGPLVDVLLRAAIGTGADVQLVPGEMDTAPQMGIGATLRYADSLGTAAAAQR